jgi:hypothetical protein
VVALPTSIPKPSPTPKAEISHYDSFSCGINFDYPKNLTKLEVATGGVMLVDGKNPQKSVAVACQADIPRPALTPENIENVKIGSISAKLYHDAADKDGAPVDKLIFTNPKTKKDIFISGYGDSFSMVVSTLIIN